MNDEDREDEDERVTRALDEENRGTAWRRINAIRERWFDALLASVGLGR